MIHVAGVTYTINLENEGNNTASPPTSIRNSSVLSKRFCQEYTYMVSDISFMFRNTKKQIFINSLDCISSWKYYVRVTVVVMVNICLRRLLTA